MKVVIFLLSFLLLGACSKKFIVQNHSPEVLFKQAEAELLAKDDSKAIATLRKLDSNYIFNPYAIDAEVLLIWLYYQKSNFDQAEVIASSFLKYFPYNEYTSWVEYMYALIIYEQIPYKKRNIEKAEVTLGLFKDYINKYPKTEYTQDLKFKLPLIKSLLASRSMEVGNYYLKHKVYIGAINRFKEVIEVYNDTIFVPEALYRLVFSLYSIGLKEEANLYFKLLEYNYSNTKWYNKANKIIKPKNTIKNSYDIY